MKLAEAGAVFFLRRSSSRTKTPHSVVEDAEVCVQGDAAGLIDGGGTYVGDIEDFGARVVCMFVGRPQGFWGVDSMFLSSRASSGLHTSTVVGWGAG